MPNIVSKGRTSYKYFYPDPIGIIDSMKDALVAAQKSKDEL